MVARGGKARGRAAVGRRSGRRRQRAARSSAPYVVCGPTLLINDSVLRPRGWRDKGSLYRPIISLIFAIKPSRGARRLHFVDAFRNGASTPTGPTRREIHIDDRRERCEIAVGPRDLRVVRPRERPRPRPMSVPRRAGRRDGGGRGGGEESPREASEGGERGL
jgi:hypothetical protein